MGLYNWWGNDKLSGTIIPIFILLNVIKFQTDTAYSINELIANASFIIIITVAVMNYYRRASRQEEINAQVVVDVDRNKKKAEVEFEKIKLERDKFEQDRVVTNFSMDVVRRQREHQFSLIMEQGDFIDEQIVNKTDHIVYMTKNLELTEHTLNLIKMQEDEIELLRLYKRHLPQKVELRFKDFIVSTREIPKIRPTEEVLSEELSQIMKRVEENTEVEELKETMTGVDSL